MPVSVAALNFNDNTINKTVLNQSYKTETEQNRTFLTVGN